MTHKERLEAYQHNLIVAQQNLQALQQEAQQAQATILQLQGAIAAMGAILQDEKGAAIEVKWRLGSAPPDLTVVSGGEVAE